VIWHHWNRLFWTEKGINFWRRRYLLQSINIVGKIFLKTDMKCCKKVGASNLDCSLRLSYFKNYDTKNLEISSLWIPLSYSSTSSESDSSVQMSCKRADITLFCWKMLISTNSINSKYGNQHYFSNHKTSLKSYDMLKRSESLLIWCLS